MKISQELFYEYEQTFIRRHTITKPNLGKIFDPDVKGQGHQDAISNIETTTGLWI